MQDVVLVDRRKMCADRLHFFGDAQLPVAAVTIGTQYDLAAVVHQGFDGRHLVFNVSIGIDANAPDQF